jgi:hypothetical protein
VRADTITLAIEEKYTPEEKAEIASKLAIAIADQETIAGEKKVSDAAFNERLKKCDAEITNLAKTYNKGYELAQIGCDIRYDHPEPGKKSYVRMDTGELVQTLDMSWEEKQETIQFPLNATPESATLAQPTDEQVNAALDATLAAGGEEVTRLCPHPGCTLFADHDGDHLIPPPEPPQADAAGAND